MSKLPFRISPSYRVGFRANYAPASYVVAQKKMPFWRAVLICMLAAFVASFAVGSALAGDMYVLDFGYDCRRSAILRFNVMSYAIAFAILWPSIIQMLRGWNAAKEELDANDQ